MIIIIIILQVQFPTLNKQPIEDTKSSEDKILYKKRNKQLKTLKLEMKNSDSETYEV